MNIVVLAGELSSAPQVRELPSGDSLVTYEVTTRNIDKKAESVPVVWFQAPASAADLDPHEPVVVTGRVRRRFFRSRGVTASRTEVVAHGVLRSGQRRRIEGALAAAMAEAG